MIPSELNRQILESARPGGLWGYYRNARAEGDTKGANDLKREIERLTVKRQQAWASGRADKALDLTVQLNGHADDILGTPAMFAHKPPTILIN